MDNCQVAVYGALSAAHYYSLIDARLYLPAEWTKDKSRCSAAGIITIKTGYKTKLELALEMIAYQQQQGIRFHWIGGEGLYSYDSRFRSSIAAMNLVYMLDIHSTGGVYVERAAISVPAKQPGRGRTPALPQADKTPA